MVSSLLYIEVLVVEIFKVLVEIGGKDEVLFLGFVFIKVCVLNDVGVEIEEKWGGDEESVGSGESFDSVLERLVVFLVISFEFFSLVGFVGE